MREATFRAASSLPLVAVLTLIAAVPAGGGDERRSGADPGDFEVVRRVLQHPRCQNCHIEGDAPLQFDDGRPHGQNVLRGATGKGAAGLRCAACHGESNLPASYGFNVPPGAPHWQLPPPERKMLFQGLAAGELCRRLKDRRENGDRDLSELLQHVSQDSLVLWGWDPGLGRAPVDVPHAEFVAAFRRWIEAHAPCPQP